jgi:hypothetical protein
VEDAVEVNELSKTETPDTQPSRPEVEKADGDSQAIEVGDDIDWGALSIDDEGVPTADDELQQQVQEAIAFLDGLWRIWNAISTPVIFLFGYVLPAFFILRDRRVKLIERALWLLATLAISWLAFLLFLWIAPLFGNPPEYEKEENTTFKQKCCHDLSERFLGLRNRRSVSMQTASGGFLDPHKPAITVAHGTFLVVNQQNLFTIRLSHYLRLIYRLA